MKENVKFKIGKRGYEKWKVHRSSPQQRASRARSPGSGDGQQKTHAQLVPGQRQGQEAAEEVGGVIRR